MTLGQTSARSTFDCFFQSTIPYCRHECYCSYTPQSSVPAFGAHHVGPNLHQDSGHQRESLALHAGQGRGHCPALCCGGRLFLRRRPSFQEPMGTFSQQPNIVVWSAHVGFLSTCTPSPTAARFVDIRDDSACNFLYNLSSCRSQNLLVIAEVVSVW